MFDKKLKILNFPLKMFNKIAKHLLKIFLIKVINVKIFL
jgi:hypothetical protein